MRKISFLLIIPVILLVAAACGTDTDTDKVSFQGLAPAAGGSGPQVVFKPDATPFPATPYPNDYFTVSDPSTLTGKRLDLPLAATTEIEGKVREDLRQLDGFGTYAPIWVSFTEPLDLDTVRDENILLIKLDGPDAGETVPLDLGKGYRPVITVPKTYWPHDPLAEANNRLMDPDNKADIDGDTDVEFVDFYEFETDTLILRPVVPMDEASRYAVVLTKDLKGVDGNPVRSPFPYVNDPRQTEALSSLRALLGRKGYSLDDVAFCWSFTTQSITKEWENIISGIWQGEGPLGYLKNEYPPVPEAMDLKLNVDFDGNPYTLNSDWLGPLLGYLLPFIGEDGMLKAIDLAYTDYFVFGTFESPSFFPGFDFGNPLNTAAISFSQDMLDGKTHANTVHPNWVIGIPKDEDRGLDGCQAAGHPYGCEDFEENGSRGADGEFGKAAVDDNGDGYTGDRGEYGWVGSDDVADPAGDNHDPDDPDCVALQDSSDPCVPSSLFKCTQGNGRLDYDCGSDGAPGVAGIDDDNNGIPDDITEFGADGSDDGASEDANGDGRLNTPPFPVVLYGHGLTNASIEALGFVSAINRFGLALVSMDAFGHGPMGSFSRLDQNIKNLLENNMNIDLSQKCTAGALSSDCQSVLMLLNQFGGDLNGDGAVDGNDLDGKTINEIIDDLFDIGLFRVITREGRAYDIDGDTYADSGKITFNANVFQTRDTVRQTIIDYNQLARIVDNFGMWRSFDFDGDTRPEVSGDFNADGRYDLGGPTEINTRGHFYMGSSLGGIHGALNMALNPRIKVGAPVSGAGGLVEVIIRGDDRTATDPIMSQTAGIIVAGTYDGISGSATLTFNNESLSEAFGYIYLPDFGEVQVTNLTNGLSRTIRAGCEPPDQTSCTAGTAVNFAVGVPADVGDVIEVVSLDNDGSLQPSVFYGIAKYHGFGADRNSPDFRQYLGMGQMVIERTDPVNMARHYINNESGEPLPGFPEKGVLIINTPGDYLVPVNTGNAIARAAGIMSLEQEKSLIDNGLDIGYVPDEGYDAPIYDPEDVDDDGEECGFPSADPRCVSGDLAPLAPVKAKDSDLVSAVRWHYVNDQGHHAFALPGMTNHGIDWGVYMINQIGYYFASDGKCIIDDPWELHAVPMIHPGPDGKLDTVPVGDDTLHQNVRVLSTLGKEPCDYPFPEVSVIGTGKNFTIDSTPAGDDVLIGFDDLYRGP